LPGERFSRFLCFGAIAIGMIALTGYALGSRPMASLSTTGKPTSAATAMALILLGTGLLALRPHTSSGLRTARLAALGAAIVAGEDLLSLALSRNTEAWQVWGARGGVLFHSYPITSILLLATSATLFLIPTRGHIFGHVISSAVLLTSVAFLFAYFLEVPSFLDPGTNLAPVGATSTGLALIAFAEVVARPRGWVVPLLSRTSTGLMSRLLLLAAFVVPFLVLALRVLISGASWFTPEVGLTLIVAANVFFTAAIVLGAGVVLHKRESDRARLASIVESSGDAIIGASSDALIESWNAGAERIFGYTAAEAIGRSVTILVPPERRDEKSLIFERIRRGERIDPFETVRVAKDGSRIVVWLSVSPILDDDGRVVGVSSIAHDITQVQWKTALLEAQLDATGDGILIVDEEGKAVLQNSRFVELWGLPKELVDNHDDAARIEFVKNRTRDPEQFVRKILDLYSHPNETSHDEVELKDGRVMDRYSAPVIGTGGTHFGRIWVFRDITETKLAAEALRDSEAALAEAQHVAHVGSAIVYPEANEIHASEEYFRIFDLQPRPGTPIQAFLNRVHEEDRDRVGAALRAAVKSGSFEAEFRIVCGDGRIRFAHGIAKRRVGNERMSGLLGTVEDVTERRLAEDVLREHTESVERSNLELERFNRLAVGRELRMVELKRQIGDLHARLGQPAPYVLRDESAESWEGNLQLVEEMESWTRERTAALSSTVDDLRNAKLAALNMMEDAAGAARALGLANRELELQILERKRSDEAHRRLATVVEQAEEIIVVTDLNWTIEYVNPAFERITGYSRQESIGQNSRILNSGEQDAELYQQLWTTIKAGRVWHGHFVNRRKDGSLYEEDATISPVRDASGTIINFVAVKRDVTAEMALGAQLRHSQRIEAIGTLAGGVAHDFNNLLQAMLSIVQLFRRKTTVPAADLEHLVQLEKTIRRGSYLTRQLLLFARRETSKRAAFELNEMLRELSPFLRRVVRENIRLTVEPADVPLWINADRGQIEQVLMNLIVNSIDVLPEGGAISIVAGRDDESAWIELSDTGSGIPQTIRDRIFEPFFTTKEIGKGTGLGLSVVHGIIVAHGGRITVECPAKGGTTFRVELPLQIAVAAGDAAVAPEEDIPNGHGERVLLVEDEKAAREGLWGILEMLGYSVVAAGTGEEALAIADELPFSVVLTDFMLPGMPGIEVVRKARERWPDVKAIVMSGYAAPDVLDSAIVAKEFQFLQKPFGMADLARTLHALLQTPEPAH
jgi:PAS domain S-box-containing protein